MRYQNGGFLSKFLSMLSQTPPVGGLEITEGFLKFSLLSGKNVTTAYLKLPPNIIAKGKIINLEQFKEALGVLRNKISGIYNKKEKVNVIVSLPFSQTFLQVFKIPAVAEKGLNEAIQLNMQMVSPIAIEAAHYDSEKIGEEIGTGQYEFLGAFVQASESDVFSTALKEAGYNPLAIEFSTLSLARFFGEAGHGFDLNRSYLVINVTEDGIDFLILRNGKLNFDYFISWRTIQGAEKTVTEQNFNYSLQRSFQQILNFYSGKWGNDLKTTIILAQGGVLEIIGKVANSFGLEAAPFSLSDFPNLDLSWTISLSLALRGSLPRGADKFITLGDLDTEDEYRNEQIKTFSRFWRNMAISTLGFFLLILIFSNSFLKRSLSRIEADNFSSGISSQSQVMTDLAELKGKAQAFNRLAEAIRESSGERVVWSDFFEKIYVLAGNDIEISRIFYQSENVPIVLSGKGKSVEAILAFRDRITEEKNFSGVNLPLSNVSQAGPEVLFNLSFSFKKSAAK